MFSQVERDKGLPFVSVVVLTFNRKKLLENCLNSLFRMDYPMSKFEVIVVDGGSTDGTVAMVHRKFPKVRFIVENRKGRSFARNTGWKHAKGLMVAYTDDDCVVDECWLRILISGFDSEEIGAVGGPLLLLLNPKSICERFDGTPVGNFHLGERKLWAWDLITANLAVRREVFDKNRFDISLAYDLEDIDFCRSLTEAGFKLLYLPQAKVHHNIDPRRVTMPHILKRAFFGGISFYIMERKRSDRIVLIATFLRGFLGGSLLFVRRRRVADFYWLAICLIAFLASVIAVDLNRNSSNSEHAMN